MLQGGKDYEIVRVIDEALGLRELRAKVNGAAGIKTKYPPNRFSVQAEHCYHPKSIEVVRKYLDSGVLAEYFNELYHKTDRCWDGHDYRRYHVLVACAMTLGCTIPDRVMNEMYGMQSPVYIKAIKTRSPEWVLPRLATIQIRQALASCTAGVPYDFGNKTMLEATTGSMFPGETTLKNVGSQKIIETKTKTGMVIPQFIGPPTDDEIGLKPIYANHLCGGCGKTQKEDGKDLEWCARCKDRKYCSKGCQKKHWKVHKIICTRAAEQMAAFMQSIQPLDFGDGPGVGGMMANSDSPVMFMS